MSVLIVASTKARAGRTALAACLAARFVQAGGKTALAKGFAAADDDPDAAAFRKLVPEAVSAEPVVCAGSAPTDEEVAEAAKRLKGLARGRDAVVVEGPAGAPECSLALARALGGKVVLIVPPGDDPAAEARPYDGHLAGVVVNPVPRYRVRTSPQASRELCEGASVPFLGWLPEDRRLVAPSVRALAERLEGEFVVWEENADRLIDHILIGGLVRESAPFYFGSRENVAVLARGDRPDMQLAALQTGTVGALLLTQGARPIEYVFYEAERLGIPVAVVQADTHEAAARLGAVLEGVRFDHPDRLARCLELVEQGLDLAALDPALARPVTG